MSTAPPIPEIQRFQNLTLKIQGQCHTWRPHSRYNTLSTHITFVRGPWALTFLFIAIESKVKVMVEVNIESHTMGPTYYWLTSLSFQVNQPSHSWDTAFSEFDLENPRSRSWVKGTLKVTTWVQHYIDSHPFRSMSIGHAIPEIQHFQNLTLKIQGQGQGWGECWKPQHVSNIIVNLPSHSWDTTFSKFDLENPRSRSWLRSKLKVTKWVWHPIDSHPFHVNRPSHSWDKAFSNFDLENSRSISNDHDVAQLQVYLQFHKTLNGINPSSSFRDMGSIRSGPSAAWFDKFLAHGQAHMGQMGK